MLFSVSMEVRVRDNYRENKEIIENELSYKRKQTTRTSFVDKKNGKLLVCYFAINLAASFHFSTQGSSTAYSQAISLMQKYFQ